MDTRKKAEGRVRKDAQSRTLLPLSPPTSPSFEEASRRQPSVTPGLPQDTHLPTVEAPRCRLRPTAAAKRAAATMTKSNRGWPNSAHAGSGNFPARLHTTIIDILSRRGFRLVFGTERKFTGCHRGKLSG